jgi:hypothetical protein
MTDTASKKNKGGRPAKYPAEGKRPTLTFRVRGSLHEQLREAAQLSGRSISEEIERRVEKSFERDLFERYFGAIDLVKLLQDLAFIVLAQVSHTRKHWRNDRTTREAVRSSINDYLQNVESRSENQIDAGHLEKIRENLKDFLENESFKNLSLRDYVLMRQQQDFQIIRERLSQLSFEEWKLLSWLTHDKELAGSRKELAEFLKVTEEEVENLIKSLLRKTGFANPTQVATWFIQHLKSQSIEAASDQSLGVTEPILFEEWVKARRGGAG